VSIGYSVIPAPGSHTIDTGPEFYFRLLANKAPSSLGLWSKDADGNRRRLDEVASPLVRSGNLAYRAALPHMHTRTILHADAGVLWQDQAGRPRVLYSFTPGIHPLPAGTPYHDLTTGTHGLTAATGLPTAAWHVYAL
jgi:hypothetical protein